MLRGRRPPKPSPSPIPDEPPPAGQLLAAPENWPEDPAPAAFHGPAGAFVRAIEPHTEADPAAILAQILVGFGNLAGRGPHFVVENTEMHTNEFLVLVGQSAKGRKGTAWNRALQALTAADGEWSRNCLRSGLASGEGLIESVRDGDGEKDQGVADKRLMVEEEEFAAILKQSQRQGNILSAVLRTAWDKGNLSNLTRKAIRATGAHISVIGHITAEELKDSLTRIEQANGFGNRFLWICTRRRRLLPGGSRHSPEIERSIEALVWAAKTAKTIGRMIWTPEAERHWHRVYCDLSSEEAGIVGSLIGRAEAHIIRLACIYALLDSSAAVTLEHLHAAIAFWEYTERCVRFIFGKRSGTPVADTILTALEKNPDGLTRNDIRDLFQRHQSAERIDNALSYLSRQRLIRSARIATGGRPRDVWRLTADPPPAAPAGLGAALRQMIEVIDDASVNRLWHEVRAKAPDATAAEIEHAVALHMPRVRSGAVRSPVGYLLTVVPAWFAGGALAEYRQAQTPAPETAAGLAGEERIRELLIRMIPEYEASLAAAEDDETRAAIAKNLEGARQWLREHPEPAEGAERGEEEEGGYKKTARKARKGGANPFETKSSC